MCLFKSLKICLLLLLFSSSLLFAKDLKMQGDATPDGANLSWNVVSDAVYYDIYIDNVFVKRLNGETSYSLTGYDQNQELDIIIGARTEDNTTLDSERLRLTTTSWEGVYKWINTTSEDNDGKMKEFSLKVILKTDPTYGQYNEIWTDIDGQWFKVFPIGELTGNYGWLDFKGKKDIEITYRLNCDRFNTTSFSPTKWKIEKIILLKNYCGVEITTKAMGLQFRTRTTYTFKINEEGKRVIEFFNEGSGLAEHALFYNPNLSHADPFSLVEQ